jgi:EpsI family protein
MAITATIIHFLSYNVFYKAEAGVDAIKNIPVNLGEWKGEDMKLEDSIYEILETKSIIHRNYTQSDKDVFLSLVYYPETKVDFHAPEGCLAGKGIEIDKTQKIIEWSNDNKTIKLGLNQLLRKNENSNELVYYFYKAGDFMGENYLKLRWALAINKFGNDKKNGALIRVSTTINNGDIQGASDLLKGFIQELYPYLVEYL